MFASPSSPSSSHPWYSIKIYDRNKHERRSDGAKWPSPSRSYYVSKSQTLGFANNGYIKPLNIAHLIVYPFCLNRFDVDHGVRYEATGVLRVVRSVFPAGITCATHPSLLRLIAE
jgi:hypothetical protein